MMNDVKSKKKKMKLYQQLDDKDEEINNQAQLIEKLKEQMVEQEELISQCRKDYEGVTQEMSRIQADNESAKDEVKEVLQALEELAMNYDQKATEVESKNKDIEQLSEELSQKLISLNTVQSEFETLRDSSLHQKKHSSDMMLSLLKDLSEIGTIIGGSAAESKLYAILLNKDISTDQAIDKCLRKIASAGHRAPTAEVSLSQSFQFSPVTVLAERLVLSMTELGMTARDLDCLPVGVALPFREAIMNCRCSPPFDWPEKAYVLIGREDLTNSLIVQKKHVSSTPTSRDDIKLNKDDLDGMESLDMEVLKLRFSEDLRIQEVRRLLQTSQPVKVSLVQKPVVQNDHEFIEEKEKHLYCICTRTMALPVGRGMFTLCTYHPLPTEALPIPKLNLTGRAPSWNTTVELTHIDTPAKMAVWPHFHNGVAAGLRIANSTQIDSAWITYNSPVGNDMVNDYAGFLMALGLNGHLINLETLNIHEYLSMGQYMTTIGVLLGLSAAKRGTMDLGVTRMLSIHLTALLPPTSTELNIPHDVQVAGILGVGLVYQGTGNLHIAEVLLAEIDWKIYE